MPDTIDHNRFTSMEKHPLICDPETGTCEMPTVPLSEEHPVSSATDHAIRIIYFTDPICSTCWGIEPQLRKLKLEYGREFFMEYHMGGLLPDWSYNSGGISKPSDVAHHWDEVSLHYDMPIDGDVWLEDPPDSSYPPSIAFKAAQIQDNDLAVHFLRRLREMVFIEKKNITRPELLQQAATDTGLDATQLMNDYNGTAQQLFQDDLQLARDMGVKGFPTLFFTDLQQHQQQVYGYKPYEILEAALLQLLPGAVKSAVPEDVESLLLYYPTLTRKEYAVLAGISAEEAEKRLNHLVGLGKVTVRKTKNGNIWGSEIPK